ncbi:MAG: hypothetical protein LLG00_16510, partial [Planctomycetaceae bacterium]|nr:hypothetical protein [Planctomycetaceae bacterium]
MLKHRQRPAKRKSGLAPWQTACYLVGTSPGTGGDGISGAAGFTDGSEMGGSDLIAGFGSI